MEKLLTVSVAAYNGAATLQKALESCLVADESLQALLDVIIIDDGSTDGTAALAQAFVQAHPGSFRLVSKVNGGYGHAEYRGRAGLRAVLSHAGLR